MDAKSIVVKGRRLVPSFYFMVLGVGDLIGQLLGKKGFSWQQLLFGIFLSIPFFIRKRDVYVMFGIFYSLIWTFFLMVVSAHFMQFTMGSHYRSGWNFVLGYLFFGFSLLCSLTLIFNGLRIEKRPAKYLTKTT